VRSYFSAMSLRVVLMSSMESIKLGLKVGVASSFCRISSDFFRQVKESVLDILSS
jgi:hypothetical protein